MFSLLSECRFWTSNPEIKIKNTDLATFRYYEEKEVTVNGNGTDEDEVSSMAHTAAKLGYAEQRGTPMQIKKAKHKLKDSIRKLNECLREHSIVYCQWKDNAVLRIMLSNGLLVNVCINVLTGNIKRVAFDKFFVGKTICDSITDVLVTKQHVILSYNQNQITFVYLQKPSLKRLVPEKISRLDPKIFNIIVGGKQGRKLVRRIACNSSFDLMAIWTKSSQNEVFPWRPTVRDQDRANVHIYKLARNKLEPVCFTWTENDPLVVEFVRMQPNQLRIVEQRVTRKGEVIVEDQLFEIVKGTRLQRIGITTIPLQSQACCQAFSPDQEKLMLGCIDGSILLFDEHRGITHMVSVKFIPTMCTWHCDSAIIMVGNERGQLQCFDISLACIKTQLISEDITPTNFIDLSTYFSYQPTLVHLMFNRKPELHLNPEKYAQLDTFVLLGFENGPLACLKIFGGCGLKGDIHTSGFTVDVLVHNYLSVNHVEKAINCLLCLNWDVYGAMCLISLHKIVNYIFKQPLTVDREAQLQKALGSFHAPVKPLGSDTEKEFGEQVRDIMRKFFHYLLRYRSFEKAFVLGIDINDDDLFMDLYNAARLDNNDGLAEDALKKAEEIIRHSGDNNSICSHSSCSVCLTATPEESSENEESTADMPRSDSRPDLLDNTSERMSESQQPQKREIIKEVPKLTSSSSYVHAQSGQSSSVANTRYREPCYMPPLPFTDVPAAPVVAAKKHSARIFIPRQQMPSPHQHRSIARNHRPSVFNEMHRVLLTDPPLPRLPPPPPMPDTGQSSVFADTPDLDDLDYLYDYVPKTASTRALVSSSSQTSINRQLVVGHGNQSDIPLTGHKVIGVFPKPMEEPKQPEYIDQTLGIPIHATPGLMSDGHGMLNARPVVSGTNPQVRIPTLYSAPPLTGGKSLSTIFNADANKTDIKLRSGAPPIVHQYPLISGQIPKVNPTSGREEHRELQPRYNAILSKPYSTEIAGRSYVSAPGNSNTSTGSNNKATGEKNKVKFSDTIVVTEIPRKEKPSDRIMVKWPSVHPDPQRELADSLPLCHPNEDYLKDFQPATDKPPTTTQNSNDDDEEGRRTSNTIKVIHFGVV